MAYRYQSRFHMVDITSSFSSSISNDGLVGERAFACCYEGGHASNADVIIDVVNTEHRDTTLSLITPDYTTFRISNFDHVVISRHSRGMKSRTGFVIV